MQSVLANTSLPDQQDAVGWHGKAWPLPKLLAEASAGNVALWVRWHGRTHVAIPSSADLVDIHDSGLAAPPVRPGKGLAYTSRGRCSRYEGMQLFSRTGQNPSNRGKSPNSAAPHTNAPTAGNLT
jgi:hypothetical protein